MKTKEEAFNLVLNKFNFTCVAEAMKRIGWCWGAGDSAHFPSPDELKETAIMLLNKLQDENYRTCATGGLEASMYGEDYELRFILEESSSRYE